MTKKDLKMRLEVCKTQLAINSEMVNERVWKETDTPHIHDYYVDKMNESKSEYLELLREVLVPNKTYVLDMQNPIIPYDDNNHIVPFLYKNMVYGEYKNDHDDYFYDKDKPGKIHKYCDAGRGTMDENKAEIIECLHCSPFTFLVDDDGNTIINGRPKYYNYDGDIVDVKASANIFDTDIICNISLASI